MKYAVVKDHNDLAELRDHHGLTLDLFAERVQRRLDKQRRKGQPAETVSRSLLGHLCTGTRKNTSWGKAKAIAEVLGVPVGAIFKDPLRRFRV